jgi:hypothetical protein
MSQHAKDRAKERYNLELSEFDKKRIMEMLRNNQMIFLGNADTPNKKFAYVTYNHIPIKVLYSRTAKGIQNIITVYPFDVDEYNDVMSKDFDNRIAFAIAFLKRNKYIVYKRKKNQQNDS